ncbi:MAG: DUF2071 domain-containing protein [Acidobacteriota bacterium]
MTAEPGSFLTARWVHLAMINHEIDPAVLEPHVPAGTVLDEWDGRCFVSLVGFRFLDTKVLGIPIPFHRHFDEVNLRFYVRREVDGELRRGVVFIKEIVPRAAIALVARVIYEENYVALPMRHRIAMADGEDRSVRYEWRVGSRWNGLGVEVEGEPVLPEVGSEEEFITEHYWGYAAQRDGSTVEYRVEHPQWRVWRATRSSLDCDVGQLYGPEFVEALSGDPSSAFLAAGSEVVVRPGRESPNGRDQ